MSPASAIAATLSAALPTGEVWLCSDLLERAAVSTAALLASNSNALIDHALPLHWIAAERSNDAGTVHVAGADRFHDRECWLPTHAKQGSLIEGWHAYLASAGGRLEIIR